MSQKIRGSKSNTFALTANTTAKKLCGKDENRTNMLIYNNGSVTAYVIANQSGAYTEGIPIIAGATYNNDTTTDALWVITSSSSTDLRVQIDGD